MRLPLEKWTSDTSSVSACTIAPVPLIPTLTRAWYEPSFKGLCPGSALRGYLKAALDLTSGQLSRPVWSSPGRARSNESGERPRGTLALTTLLVGWLHGVLAQLEVSGVYTSWRSEPDSIDYLAAVRRTISLAYALRLQ